MTEQIFDFVSQMPKEAAIFLLSMIPVTELRLAIPFAIGQDMHPLMAYVMCVLGNLLPVPFILLFIRSIFNWMKKFSALQKLVARLEQKGMKNADKVLRYEFWGLVLFVGIPLPGTGAWTGALIAALLDMRLQKAFPAIALGVALAGIIVTLLSSGVFTLIR